MLTTKDSQAIRDKVATDLNANITLPSAKARVISPEAALLFDKGVVARPLGVPSVCDIRVKDLNYRYRWVNRDGMAGQVYQQRKAQGFTNATSDDVEVLGGNAEMKDGEIRSGDLILMKMQAERYDAAIKSNMLQAMRLQNVRGAYLKSGSSDVMSDEARSVGTVSEAPPAKHGAEPFIPQDVEAIVGDSIRSGRVDRTREVTNSMGKQGE